MSVAELLRRELAGDIEQGDRIPYGPIDLIVRSVDDDHQIVDVGLALEHTRRPPPQIPLFQGPKEIVGLLRYWRGWWRKPKAETQAETTPLPPGDGEGPAG